MTVDVETTAERIEATRIQYTVKENGVGIDGCPFLIEFETPLDGVEEFCQDVFTAEEPWNMFGVWTRLADDYLNVAGVAYHVDEGELRGASKVDVEVCPDWARIYVKEDASAERIAEFVATLVDKVGATIEWSDDVLEDEGVAT